MKVLPLPASIHLADVRNVQRRVNGDLLADPAEFISVEPRFLDDLDGDANRMRWGAKLAKPYLGSCAFAKEMVSHLEGLVCCIRFVFCRLIA